ncbi:hypothetical protein STEG23_035258 [Scotinomys teguina]
MKARQGGKEEVAQREKDASPSRRKDVELACSSGRRISHSPLLSCYATQFANSSLPMAIDFRQALLIKVFEVFKDYRPNWNISTFA